MAGWTGWVGRGRWAAVEGVAEGHPVDPVHPVCGEKKGTGWQDGQDGLGEGDGRRWRWWAEGQPVNPEHPVGHKI